METKSVTNTKYTTFENFCDQRVKPNSGGKDLYGHLSNVMQHLVLHNHPSQSLNKLEEVSYLLKNPELQEEFLVTRVHKDYAKPSDEDLKNSTSEIISKGKEFFKT